MIRIEFTTGNPAEEAIVDQMLRAIPTVPCGVSTTWKEDDEIIVITLLD